MSRDSVIHLAMVILMLAFIGTTWMTISTMVHTYRSYESPVSFFRRLLRSIRAGNSEEPPVIGISVKGTPPMGPHTP